MENEPFLLVVDLGASGCKSALVSVSDRIAAWDFQELPQHVLPNAGVE